MIPVVAANVALVCPEAMVTLDGTANDVALLEIATTTALVAA